MKTLTKITTLLLIILSVFSCDEADELTEIDLTETITTTLNVDIPEDSQGQPETFSQTTTLDLASNQEIQDNIDLIQNVSIDALNFEIDNFSGEDNAMITDASISFGNDSIQVSDFDLQQADINNTVFPVSDAATLNAISNSLENNTQITVTLSGTVSSTPVVFDVIVSLDVTVTVDVI